jgi:hypothetical protein
MRQHKWVASLPNIFTQYVEMFNYITSRRFTMKSTMQRFLLAACSAIVLFAGTANAAEGLSNISANMSAALSGAVGSVVAGSVTTLGKTAEFSVMAVEKTGQNVILVLRDTSTGAVLSVKTAAAGASLAVGTSVKVVAEASGHALIASGKLVAYIPNEIGKSLLHSKKSSERVSDL